MERKIKFICNAVKWFDRVNGNTYHSVVIERMKDGKVLKSSMSYGYDGAYKQTALELMAKANWIPAKYSVKHSNGSDSLHLYDRENNYPIVWNVKDGLKRDLLNNII